MVLLLGALVLLCAIAAVRLSHRLGLPSLLAYLALGLLIGESGLGVRFDDAQLAQALGLAALALILAEGGLTTSWTAMRPVAAEAVVLATLGVGVSVLVTAAAAHYLLGLDPRLAVLVAAALSPTDAAAVFSVLRRLPLPPRLAGTLEAESGFNDAPVVILVTLLSVQGGPASPWGFAAMMSYQLAVGAAVGVSVGWAGGVALRRVALPASGLYPLTVLGLTMGSYAGAALLHASGFLAVYLAGLVLGNIRLPHRAATRGFAESVAWLAQIGLFVMLGLLASPSELPREVLPSLLLGFALLLVARPVSVVVSILPFRFTRGNRLGWRDQAFLSWTGLRGAVPIVLATVPVGSGVAGAERLFAMVFVIVVVFTLLQGPTLPWAARRLGVSAPAEPVEIDVESAPLEDLGAELLQVRIPRASRLHGVEIFELRLPAGAAITLVVRDRRSFVPDPTTVLRRGDELLVVTTAEARETTERRLRAVSRRGKLAGWFGERGD
ncbi:MAG: potassium/proton antiporter [Streptosporangiales bacterium]|nr:potassium/proton antiporter [Streptosporangiales bacterium]